MLDYGQSLYRLVGHAGRCKRKVHQKKAMQNPWVFPSSVFFSPPGFQAAIFPQGLFMMFFDRLS